jgi:hypothetical protein
VRQPNKLRHLLWILPLAAVMIAVACSDSGVKSPTAATSVAASSSATSGSGTTPGTGGSGSSGTGTLSVMLKDSPFSEATAVLVTFSGLSAHISGDGTNEGEWVTLDFADSAATSRTCDLKRLVESQDVLGIGVLPAGHYTQLRLTVASVSIYFEEVTDMSGPVCATDLTTIPATEPEVSTPVDVPSGTLKLNREFDVPEGGATTILLDFDGDKSIHMTGNGKYKMTPVIGVVSVQ